MLIRVRHYGLQPIMLTADKFGFLQIYESDEYFPTFCIIKYEFEPILVLDEEYSRLTTDGRAFIDDIRAKKIRQEILEMIRPKIV